MMVVSRQDSWVCFDCESMAVSSVSSVGSVGTDSGCLDKVMKESGLLFI